jgi:hypothetical protein
MSWTCPSTCDLMHVQYLLARVLLDVSYCTVPNARILRLFWQVSNLVIPYCSSRFHYYVFRSTCPCSCLLARVSCTYLHEPMILLQMYYWTNRTTIERLNVKQLNTERPKSIELNLESTLFRKDTLSQRHCLCWKETELEGRFVERTLLKKICRNITVSKGHCVRRALCRKYSTPSQTGTVERT